MSRIVMKFGGTSVGSVDRIKNSLKNKNFINRIFNEKEILKCKKTSKSTNCFAKRFAAKEAFSGNSLGANLPKVNIHSKKIEEKINEFGFASDRADVIDFGLKIYERIIKKLEIKAIQSTKWGVSDSIAVKIFHEVYSKKISIYKEK